MSKKGQQVTPVDPVATSNAQSAANIATAQAQQKLNLINSSGPDGSVTYSADPNAPGGYSQTTTLSPGQQGIYDQSNAAQLGALGVANQQLGRVSTALGQSLNTSSLPALVGSVNTGGYGQQASGQQPAYGSAGPGKQGAQSGLAGANINTAGQAQQQPGYGSAGPGELGGQGAAGGGLASANIYTSNGGQAPTQAATAAHPTPSQPGAAPSTSGIQSQVAPAGQIQTSFNMGGPVQYGYDPGQAVQGQVGSQDLQGYAQQQQNAAYSQAASRLDPQYATQENQLRTQLANQGLSQNDDAYKSALDSFSRGKTDAYSTAQNNAVSQGNAAAQQLFGQSLQQGQFANSAAAQEYAQNQGQAAFNNTAAGQDFTQNLGAANFGNAAQQQQYAQNANNVTVNNAAQQQQYGEQLSNAQLGMNQQNQQFNQGLSNAQLSNAARQQGLSEQAYIQNTPINQFATLLGAGGQVAMPTGINYTPSQVANTDVLGAYALNQQGQIANAQAKSAAASGTMNGLMSLGSAAILASDRRLKTDIEHIRTRKDGVNLYRFRYHTDPANVVRVGVMAQELKKVRPDLVVRRADGFLTVNYAGLDLEAA